MDFAETVAVNRGMPISVFPTVAQARAWLLGVASEQVAAAQGAPGDPAVR
jgi:hypothetical protein